MWPLQLNAGAHLNAEIDPTLRRRPDVISVSVNLIFHLISWPTRRVVCSIRTSQVAVNVVREFGMGGREIADSDAESDDFGHNRLPEAGNGAETADHDPAGMLDDIDFDKFVSLDSGVERRRIQRQTEGSSRDVAAEKADGSNQVASFREGTKGQKHESAVEQSASIQILGGSAELGGSMSPLNKRPISTSLKRRHTGDVVSGPAELNASTESEELGRKNKRSKTYGRSKTRLINAENHIFTDAAVADTIPRPTGGEREIDLGGALASRGDTQPLSSIKTPAQWSGQMYSNNNLLAPTISTTKSSMGVYQSISIDLRGTSSSLDFDGNPFGTVSQVSIGDDEDAARIIGFFGQQRGQINDSGDDSAELIASENIDNGHIAAVIDPSMLMRSPAPLSDTQLLSSSSILKSASTEGSRSAAQLSDPLPEEESSVNLPIPKPEESRTGEKRGRKRRSDQPMPSSSEPDRAATDKLDAAELEIGLSKERYKPRPSRSRRSTSIIHAETHSSQNDTEQLLDVKHPEPQAKSSPAKNPSSELHLSDEAYIGLPKESYVPRPSRSRSKRVVHEHETSINDTETADAGQDIEASQPNTTPAPDSTSKGRKEKRAKLKRAKTSLAKKSEPMLSEGDDEVVWMESKPAKVKIGKLQDVSPTKSDIKLEEDSMNVDRMVPKKRADIAVLETNNLGRRDREGAPDTEDEDDILKPTKRTTIKKPLVSVEIPAPHAQSSIARNEPQEEEKEEEEKEEEEEPAAAAARNPAAPEPKKRGRKRKKPVEPEPRREEEIAESKVNHNLPHASQTKGKKDERPPLQEQPINTSLPLPPAPVVPRCTPSPSHHQKPTTTTKTSQSPTPFQNQRARRPHSPLKSIIPALPASPNDQHKPRPHPSSSSGGLSTYRVGLSRRAPIPSLLKIVRKDEDQHRRVAVGGNNKKKKEKQKEKEGLGEGGAKDGGKDEEEMKGLRECGPGDVGPEDGDGGTEAKKGLNELLMMEEEYYSP